MSAATDDLLARLATARRQEKGMTLFYRALAAEAELEGREEEAERLNGLHADEQHHLSRLTARLLELGVAPESLREIPRPTPGLDGWEGPARDREAREIAFYREWVAAGVEDDVTLAIVNEILESEEHHHRELGGKWMSA